MASPLSSTVEKVKSWISECISEHSKCRQSISGEKIDDRLAESVLPGRVIYITPIGTLKLMEPTPGQRGRYVALSYCWGDTSARPFLKLTKSNIAAFRRDIPHARLPKTIQDAIETTKRLGLQLLWVDALCIIQDQTDKSDWTAAVNDMGRIYQRASLTIAILGERNSFTGFLGPRNRDERYVPIPWTSEGQGTQHDSRRNLSLSSVFSCNDMTGTDKPSTGLEDELLRSSWFKRAWTFEEHLLSRRVLFFGDFQVYWQCQSASFSEDAFDEKVFLGPNVVVNNKLTLMEALGKGTFGHRQPSHDRSEREFRLHVLLEESTKGLLEKLTYQYSSRALSMPNDKLAAFAGFAATPAGAEGRTCVSGLWLGALGPRSLCWMHLNSDVPRSRPLRAPTWSWANCDNAVVPGVPMDFSRPFCQIQAVSNYNPLMRAGSSGSTPTSITIKGRCHRAVCLPQTCASMSQTWAQLVDDIGLGRIPRGFAKAGASWAPRSCHLLFLEQIHSSPDVPPASLGRSRKCVACHCSFKTNSESLWLSQVENCKLHGNELHRDSNASTIEDRLIGVAYFDNAADFSEQVELIPLTRAKFSAQVCPAELGSKIYDTSQDSVQSSASFDYLRRKHDSQSLRGKVQSIAAMASDLTTMAREKLQRLEVLYCSTEDSNSILPYSRCVRSFQFRDVVELARNTPRLYSLLLVKPHNNSPQVYQRIGIATAFWLPGVTSFGGVDLQRLQSPEREIVLI